jgi:hypothetical protein
LIEPVLTAAGGWATQDTIDEGLRMALSGSTTNNGHQQSLTA